MLTHCPLARSALSGFLSCASSLLNVLTLTPPIVSGCCVADTRVIDYWLMYSSPRTRIESYQNIAEKLRHRGAYVDYWTWVHFASGTCIGYFLSQMGFGFFGGFVVCCHSICVVGTLRATATQAFRPSLSGKDYEPDCRHCFGRDWILDRIYVAEPERAYRRIAGSAGCPCGLI